VPVPYSKVTLVAWPFGSTLPLSVAVVSPTLEAGFAATDYRAAMTFLQTQVRARSLLVIFTNLLEPRSAKELASSLRGFLPRHLPLCVLMRDTDVESLAVAPAQSEADLYVRASAAEATANFLPMMSRTPATFA